MSMLPSLYHPPESAGQAQAARGAEAPAALPKYRGSNGPLALTGLYYRLGTAWSLTWLSFLKMLSCPGCSLLLCVYVYLSFTVRTANDCFF